jgi:hypothetical protein
MGQSCEEFMRSFFMIALFILGCPEQKEPVNQTCEGLFGLPSENTGLSDSECQPVCHCGESSWQPLSTTEETILSFEAATLLDGPEPLTEDPYSETPDAAPDESAFCAIQRAEPDSTNYRLLTTGSEAEATEVGASITHKGACGLCSSLQNLSVYLRNPDLTDPVRECGMLGMLEGQEANIDCLMDIGFDFPCAQIWYYNTNHTRQVCLEPCLAALEDPHHNPDGSLNDCLQCDEDQSGAVFKAGAGRTRRNSGLASALCRPCDSVYQVTHSAF